MRLEMLRKSMELPKDKIEKMYIVRDLLTPAETDWLNQYHRTVYEQLSPSLDEDERLWLEKACKAI